MATGIIHLDTSFLIECFKHGSESSRRLDSFIRDGNAFEVSMMAWAEWLCGPLKPAEKGLAKELIGAIHPVTESQAELAAFLFNETDRRPRSLADCIIAACAMDQGVHLATNNLKHFKPFVAHGLKLA